MKSITTLLEWELLWMERIFGLIENLLSRVHRLHVVARSRTIKNGQEKWKGKSHSLQDNGDNNYKSFLIQK